VTEWHLLSDSPKGLCLSQAITAAGSGELGGPVGSDDNDMIHARVRVGFE
jgi:hypothetical protein